MHNSRSILISSAFIITLIALAARVSVCIDFYPHLQRRTRSEYFNFSTSLKEEEFKFVNAQQVDYQSLASVVGGDSTESDSEIVMRFYLKYQELLEGYTLDYYNKDEISFSILRDPCRFKQADECVEGLTEEEYSDNSVIIAGRDLALAFKTNASILHCEETWERLVQCGTYIELHRPFSPEIIDQESVTDLFLEEYKFFYLSTKSLCAGKYEIWVVVRSRVGAAQQYVVPFYVESPDCGCQYKIYLPESSSECP